MEAHGAVDSLLGRLSNLLVDEARLLSGVHDDVRFIRDEMATMHAFLLRFAGQSNEHIDPLALVWMNQVREVAIDAELYVNRYASCLDGGDHGDCCGPVERTARLLATIPARHRLATHIRDLKSRAREVAERRTRYIITDPLPPSSMDGPGGGQGMESDFDKQEDLESRRMLVDDDSGLLDEVAEDIIGWIFEHNDGAIITEEDCREVAVVQLQRPKVISVLGLRGTGKTFLARKVHNIYGSMPNQKAFWISLGEDQSRRKVLESILLIITPDLYMISWDLDTLKEDQIVDIITTRFRDMKLLLVLDDVSSESLRRDIGDVFTFGCSPGSAILLVTSMPQVVNLCNPDNTIDFNNFPEHHRTSMVNFFLERALSLVSDNQDLLDVIRSILTNCSPSIFTMKMFLRSLLVNVSPDRNIAELRNLENNLHPYSPFNVNQMLKFSYQSLPRHYRNCLAYAALNPRDHNFRRTSLVRRWLADGIIISRRHLRSASEEASDVANRCFDALCTHKFLLPLPPPKDEYDRHLPANWNTSTIGRLKSCRVHGIVQDFISTIVEEKSGMDENLSPDMVKHISIQNEILQACRDPTTLVKSVGLHSRLNIINVLDLEGCCDFKDGHLEVLCTNELHLKYLSLRETGISHLPKKIITKLRNLETLDIRQTEVSKLDIVPPKLKQLLVGRKGYSFSTIKIPRNISSITTMEVLSHVEVSRDDELIILGQLRLLRKLGVVFNKKRSGHLMQLLFSQIEMLQSCIRSLSIRIEGVESPLRETTRYTSLMFDSPVSSPPRLLHTLNIRGAMNGLPPWITDLHQLAKITLKETYLEGDTIHVLGKLPALQSLRLLDHALSISHIVFTTGEFKKLVVLSIEDNHINISDVTFDNGTAPKLERVVFRVTKMSFLYGIEYLSSLKELHFNGFLYGDNVVKHAIAQHPNWPRFNYSTSWF